MGRNAPIRSNRRKELIESTITVIAAHGYHGTTVGRVAKAAGVSTGLMNFHFESKDKLFEAVFQHLESEYDQVWQERIAASPQEPWPLLNVMIETYFDREVFTGEKLAVWFAFWSDPALRDKFRDAATAVERRYVKELEQQLLDILADHPAVEKVAQRATGALSAMIDGFWLQALLYPKKFKTRDAVKSCIAFVQVIELYYRQERELVALRRAVADHRLPNAPKKV